MTDFLDPDADVLQHMVYFENLEADLNHLLPLYNYSVATMPQVQPDALRYGRQDISEETMNFIRTYYRGDFVNFGYPDP
ncbi:cya1 [Symbiodinium pilosum]|uniref:Cya1 protein n=1 Tax=Symbiodinium pilosum TaxID=2952 RepID=A0A812WAN3_SYMPI|nr:cya1 [Symbiodinium pilosum]